MLTPGRRTLGVPTEKLANLLAEEWQAQEASVDLQAMPITRMCHGAADRSKSEWHRLRDEIANYAASDLLCYWAEEPADLAELQEREWLPLLDWAKATIGLDLKSTRGIIAIPQDKSVLKGFRAWLEPMDNFRLAGLHPSVTLLGSVVTGLALLNMEISPQKAMEVCFLDEIWQESRWGHDDEAAARRMALNLELNAINAFMRCLDSPAGA
jgi:chaperone required for assembly of F1-ATPase